MPWTLDDYPSSLKNLSKSTKKKAIDIANALVEEGYKEDQAIPIATKQAKEWADKTSEKDKENYYKTGQVTKHDHTYESNPERLAENEIVKKEDDKWVVRSEKAKRATKKFDDKNEAIDYAKQIAKNKQTKLKVYKADGDLQETTDYS